MPISPPDTPLSSGRSTAPLSPSLPCVAAAPSAAAASSSSSSSTSSAADPLPTQHVYTIRHYPIMLSVGREAAAASAGMDLTTYNLLMELQQRDITPEDYDMLRRLDSSVQPKTLSRQRLDQLCPSWVVPAADAAAGVVPAVAGAAAPPATEASAPVTRKAAAASAAAAAAAAAAAPAAKRPCRDAVSMETCSICLEPFACKECMRRLPCRHLFHTTCIDHWLTSCSNLCPECNVSVE